MYRGLTGYNRIFSLDIIFVQANNVTLMAAFQLGLHCLQSSIQESLVLQWLKHSVCICWQW